MEAPILKYNKGLFNYIKKNKEDLEYMPINIELLGSGAAGTAFTANIASKYDETIVLKEHERTRFCDNELEALRFLRQKMLKDEFPAYFIFMYGYFSSGDKRYMILEKSDINFDDYFTKYNGTPADFLRVFWHIANAVSYLEEVQFNHGDLWSENVMFSWKQGQENVPEEKREFDIKILDFDSSYMANSRIVNPSYGGADKFRKKFILGYDLNRFFDGLLYTYNSYIEMKIADKKRWIARLKKLQKQGVKDITISSLDEKNSIDREYDEENIVYPSEIIEFMNALDPLDPNVFRQCPRMSGKYVKKFIIEFAQKKGIKL